LTTVDEPSERVRRFVRIAARVGLIATWTGIVGARAYNEGESVVPAALAGFVIGGLMVLWLVLRSR
jgi:hypothetical protein